MQTNRTERQGERYTYPVVVWNSDACDMSLINPIDIQFLWRKTAIAFISYRNNQQGDEVKNLEYSVGQNGVEENEERSDRKRFCHLWRGGENLF